MKHRLLVSAALFAFAVLPAQAQLFGPSREEREAEAAREAAQDSQISANADAIERAQQTVQQLQGQIRDLNDRVRNLTDSLARATGANEELGFQVGQLNNRISQQERDFTYRLCVISAQQLGADAQSMNCAATGAGNGGGGAPQLPQFSQPGTPLPPIMPNSVVPGGNANPNMGRAPGVLGTLPGPSPAPSVARPAAPAAGGDSGPFDAAMNMLARQQYAEAAAAFRSYADANPGDQDLAPQAIYWVGQIAYMQQDYAGASRAFAEQIKKYPKSPRGADSMLRMGQALVAQGQTRNGCTAFAAIAKQYPNASQSTKTAATNARRAANCS